MQLAKHNRILHRNQQLQRGQVPDAFDPKKVGEERARLNQSSVDNNPQRSFIKP